MAGDVFAAWLAADCGYRKWGIVLIVIWVSRHCKVQLIRLRHDVSMCVLLEFQGLQSCFHGECQPCCSGAQAEPFSNSRPTPSGCTSAACSYSNHAFLGVQLAVHCCSPCVALVCFPNTWQCLRPHWVFDHANLSV